MTKGSLEAFVPQGGHRSWMAVQVGLTQLPDEVARHRAKIVEVLQQGGILEIQADGEPHKLLGRNLKQWAELFPDLELRLKWGPEGGEAGGAAELTQEGAFDHSLLNGELAIPVSKLKGVADAADLQRLLLDHRFRAPTYPVGPSRQVVEAGPR